MHKTPQSTRRPLAAIPAHTQNWFEYDRTPTVCCTPQHTVASVDAQRHAQNEMCTPHHHTQTRSTVETSPKRQR